MTVTAEHELIERCRQGDDEAFRELVDQYKRFVFALIARSVSDHARVEELSQEVFLRIYRGLPHFRGESRLSTWIYRILNNVVAGDHKPRLRAVSLDTTAAEDQPHLEPGVIDRAYSDVELRDRLDKAIERLPPQYQSLVNGHYFGHLGYEELADALQIPLGTVKTHLHRAKRLLRQSLERDLG